MSASDATWTAEITADEDVECPELTRTEFDRIVRAQPQLAAQLVGNVLWALAQRLRITSRRAHGRIFVIAEMTRDRGWCFRSVSISLFGDREGAAGNASYDTGRYQGEFGP